MMYVPQMKNIADRVNKPVKLVQCIQAHNEEEFILPVLNSIYDQVDRIIVVEGAVKNRPNSTGDGHSIDRTLELIDSFDDRDDKIELITIDRHWSNLEEMKSVFLRLTEVGDWLIINDADEIYISKDIKRVRMAIDRNPQLTEIIPTFLHFYKDFKHVALPGPEWNLFHQRIFKNQGSMKYNTHPVVTDKDGQCTYFSPQYWNRRVLMNDFYIYHYGYARSGMDKVMVDKQKYYEGELAKHDNANLKFDQKVKDWTNCTEPCVVFNGEHPEVMRSHPMFDFQDDSFSANLPDYNEITPYKEYNRSEQFGSMWLNQTEQAMPNIPFFHNEVFIK